MSMNTLREPVVRCRPLVQASPPRIKSSMLKTTQNASLQPGNYEHSSAIPFLLNSPSSQRSVANRSTPSDPFSRQLANPISANLSKYPSLHSSYHPTISAPLAQTRQADSTRSTFPKKKVAGRKTKSVSFATTTFAPELGHGQISEQTQPLYTYTTFEPRPTRLYIKTALEANRVLESMSGPVGFDMEWKVLYRKNGSQSKAIQRPVAVVQIANQRSILIFQTSAMKEFPKKLKEILEDPMIVKTGDAKKLYNDYKVKAHNLVELSWLSRQADTKLQLGGTANNRKLISLQKLCQTYLGKDLPKDENHAANDAHCSIMLYHHLIELAKTNAQELLPQRFTLNVSFAGEVITMEDDQLIIEDGVPEALMQQSTKEVEGDKLKKLQKPRKPVQKPLEVIEISDSDSDTYLDEIVEDFIRIRLGQTSQPKAAPEVKGPERNNSYSRDTISSHSNIQMSRTMGYALFGDGTPKF
ncbi:ribonuclease H-like protein [Serendipita vermifera]|nr:ribonuclease H-like protein [Serendipita vermifera]